MKITQEVRDYARQQAINDEEALAMGLQSKAQEFKEQGGEIYQKVY
jgi:phosphomethylpyrimidine synthase